MGLTGIVILSKNTKEFGVSKTVVLSYHILHYISTFCFYIPKTF